MGLNRHVGDATNVYANSSAPDTATYLAIYDAYAEWCKNATQEEINYRHVFPVQYLLQGYPESSKMWMNFKDNTIIK